MKHSPLLGFMLTLPSPLLYAQENTDATQIAAPCMDVFDRFTAPDVPAMGPDEEIAGFGNPNVVTPPNFPKNGSAQHPMLYVSENCNVIFLIENGKPIWNYPTGKGPEYDDIWMLSNGNVLFTCGALHVGAQRLAASRLQI